MKKVISFLLALLLLTGICPLAVTASAVSVGSKVEFGSYPQTLITDKIVTDTLDKLADTWKSYGYSHLVSGINIVQTGDFMKYCDVTYNGQRYRGVKMTAYRPDRTDSMCIRPLNADYDLNTVYWFKYEPLIWRVLDVSTGLMVCDLIVDAQPFYSGGINYNASLSEKYQYTTQSDPSKYPNMYYDNVNTVCGWLRRFFKETAFSVSEQGKLQKHTVVSDATDAKFRFSSTNADVFLLTSTEVAAYLKDKFGCKIAKSSDYAKIQGVDVMDYSEKEDDYLEDEPSRYNYVGCSPWLLATAGSKSNAVLCIDPFGYGEIYDVRYTGTGIRPAVCVGSLVTSLKIHECFGVGFDYTVDIPAKEPTCTNPGIYENTGWYCTLCNEYYPAELAEHKRNENGEDHIFGEYQTVCDSGDALMFGSYPQTLETDSEIKSQLSTLQLEWKSYDYYTFYDEKNGYVKSDYMKYADVDIDNDGRNDYRGVVFTQFRPISATLQKPSADEVLLKRTKQDDYGYTVNTVYWFKYEPLVWRVLDKENGILMCEYAIDSQAFNDTVYEIDKNGNGEIDGNEYFSDKKGDTYADDYSESTLRKFLNGMFLNTAFTSAQKKNLVDTSVDVKEEDPYHIGFRTEYLYKSVTDKVFLLSIDEYLWSGLINSSSEKLRLFATDYALCQGIYTYNSTGNETVMHLRTGCCDGTDKCSIIGAGNEDFEYTDSNDIGVCPTVKVNNIDDLLHKHQLKYADAVPATCIRDGKTQGISCETCGKVFEKQVKIDKTAHKPVLIDAVAPTCEAAGHNVYYQCETCKKYYTTVECTQETTVKAQTLPALNHDWKEIATLIPADCTNGGKVTMQCRREACQLTATKDTDPLGHLWDSGKITVPAKCTEDGVKTFTCTRESCGATDEKPIAAKGHSPVKIDAQPATCQTTGNREYYCCEICKKCYLAADCTVETTSEAQTLSMSAHIWDEGKVTKAPEVGVKGIKTYTCTVCHTATKTEETDALPDDGMMSGDVDNNGKIEAADARLALRASVGLEALSETQTKAADVDNNGKVEAADARLILRASVGLEDADLWKKTGV